MIKGGVTQSLIHDSAQKHVTGQAIYVDDMPEPPGTLHIYVAMSSRAHARITSLDLSAVRTARGVAAVLSTEDIPGMNDASPVTGDDPVFADGVVEHHGQSIFAVAADTIAEARAAANKAKIVYEDLPALLTIEDALAANSLLEEPYEMKRGEPQAAIASSPHQLSGQITIGGQEHFYLEGQIAFAIPDEDEDMTIWSSTQHPSEVQHTVAKVLGVANNAVTVNVRRMGGAFGGKESQSNLLAAIAGLAARVTGRPAKLRYDRDDDMALTGKRHDFRIDYEVGFDNRGRINGIVYDQAVRCGRSGDLSAAISDRAMFHADNCYFLEHALIRSVRCKTHTVSATAFRGFGGPQGMLGMERVIDEIAHALGLDPLAVRKANFYDPMDALSDRSMTPYGMEVEDCIIQEIIEELETSSDYQARRAEIANWNAGSPLLKRGIALTPVKFGISFTTPHLNQAGALVHVYNDGSIHLNHGGTEMGQGLYVKVAQVVAEEFQVDIGRIKITGAHTGKVPNTSATAASSGSDINGMAACDAARKIKARLAEFAATQFQCAAEDIRFENNQVVGNGASLSFDDLVAQAYIARISLSATGFYATPKIFWDREMAQGRPFYYFSYGAAVSEVILDTLTGENRLTRVDILHDVGTSLNPAIDLGQIEGGFVQGAGWLTTEELWWDANGKLMTHSPSTYKIPTCSDRAPDMRIALWEKGRNREETIYRSKAVGEPPLMLAISTLMALSHALSAANGGEIYPALDTPATPERLLTTLIHSRNTDP